MIIKEISSFVAVDEIFVEDSGKYVHFVTHLDRGLNVPDNWGSIIYTSRHVAKILTLKKFPIPKKFFRIIEPNEELLLMLRDGKTIRVRMFTNDGFNGNVMFYFQCGKGSKTTVLYTGPFIRYRSILLNEHFRKCVLAGIDHLYVDNTRANSIDNETIQTVGCKIQEILQKYPDHIIMLDIPPFGYEDLIFSLVKDFGLNIFGAELQVLLFKLNKLENIYVSNIMDAKIIVGEEPVTLEKIKYRFSLKRITVRFCESNFAPKYNDFEKIGYFQIHWTPHPSLVQLYAFIDFVKPQSVSKIYDDMPNLPTFLTSLCQKKSIENCDDVVEESNKLNIAENQTSSIANRAPELNLREVSNIDHTRTQRYDTNAIDTSDNYPYSTYLRRQIELPRNLAKERTKNSLLRNIAVIKPNNAIASLPQISENEISHFNYSSASIICENEPNNAIPADGSITEDIENENNQSILSGTELSSNLSIESNYMCLIQNQTLVTRTSQSYSLSPVIVFDDDSQQSDDQSHLFNNINNSVFSQPHCSVDFLNNSSTLLSDATKNRKKCKKRSNKVKSPGKCSFSRGNKSQCLSRDLGLLSCEPIEIFSDDTLTTNSSLVISRNKLSNNQPRASTTKLQQTPNVSCQTIQTKKKTNLFSSKAPQIMYSSDED